ncbi:MAG TPA: CoA-acylating methylmalonate-semialdehyde dehydrogenase [Anaerolineales bacterium]|nr:CoA-acylating methylmalonate-semialdehyde dehydrogenase [Anaerolineales bacterium]HNQ93688.1 CoA-acylating methylmalonate-semialdehyde dehydrogenase [Anaerolineales bacterium]HNS60440.1 CoA-acylating methylmalonate-semialdehyde dehydrogenase [Anaerolineales bacterium]
MEILNYINNQWTKPNTKEYFDVINPATGQVIAKTPLGTKADVESAAKAASAALPAWRRIPVNDRVQYLFKLRNLMRENADEIGKLITNEAGKTFEEAKAEMVRAYENIEVACGMPMMMKGEFVEDIATGIDELMIRQPVGVCATIAPFNFPGMIPFWYLPYAIAAGNTYIIKPSEKVPMTMQFIMKLIEQVGFPKGVVNLVNGAKETVDGILEHPSIRAVTFVGSTNVAKYIYATAAAHGKRVQAQGGAKNPVIVLPDADMDMATKIIADSAFGCAGQRCLAVSFAVTVGSARSTFSEAICDAASSRVVGYGMDSGVQMGPVINAASKSRVESLIGLGVKEGASLPVDGRGVSIQGYESGHFIRPTILADVPRGSEIAKTEIFGPVLSLMHVETVDEAIELINSGQYGNQASLFTSSGSAARKFRYEAEAGNIGINIGVAAPMAFFPFSGWKDSFFGDMHGQAMDAVEFFTQKKVVVERWPKEWSRRF